MTKKTIFSVIDIIVFLAALFGLVALASAEQEAVAKINNGHSWGSGVYIGDRLVLTCQHISRGEPNNPYVFFKGTGYHGRFIKTDPVYDLGLIELDEEPNVTPALLAETTPQPGEEVIVSGFEQTGGSDHFVYRKEHVAGYSSANQNDTAYNWVKLTGTVRGGCSGGPVFNSLGRVIGSIWGSSDTTTASLTGRTLRFLLPWNARLEAVRLTQCSSGSCGTTYRMVPRYEVQIQRTPRQMVAPVQAPTGQNPDSGLVPIPKEYFEALENKVNKNREDIDKNREDIDKNSAAITANSAAIDINTAAIAAMKPGKNYDHEINEINQQITNLNQQIADLATNNNLEQQLSDLTEDVAALKEKLKDAETVDQNNEQETKEQETKEEIEEAYKQKIWIYYTARNVPGLETIDQKIQNLRDQGYPIVVTYLTPQQASVQGVPMIFIPAQNKRVEGVNNCAQYLASLIPR